ncbi:unnamed protein product [Calypogeia fissa]
MYRAIVQKGFNPQDPYSTLELVSKPIPTAARGHVVVHLTLRPVNRIDLVLIKTGQNHDTPGGEGFGIVETIGEGVTRVKPGQRVVPLLWGEAASAGGSWQEFVIVKEEFVIPIPDTISDEAAAQFVINPWTLIGLLEEIKVPKGEYLILTAAASVLGRQLVQLAKHKGIKTITTVRKAEQKEELLALGADEVIITTTEDIVTRVKEITGGKLAYGALEAVAGDTTKAVAASMRNQGQVFVYGALSSFEASVGILDLFRGVVVQGWVLDTKWDDREYLAEQTLTLLADKVMEPLPAEKIDFANFQEAIKEASSVGRKGKVLLSSP